MLKKSSSASAIITAFPNIQAIDITDAIEVAKLVDSQIIGRVCGNYGDKISQYLSIINYFRTTDANSFDSLEIGTLFGGSCIIKLMAMRNLGVKGRVICIDPMTGYYGTFMDPLSGLPVIPEMFWANIRKFGFSEHDVELVTHKSSDPASIAAIHNMKFATIMIDGDHTYQGVSYDWDHFSPYIADNGIVLIDDFAEASWPDITSFAGSCLGPNISSSWRDGGVLGSTYILQKKCHTIHTHATISADSLANVFLPPEAEFSLDHHTLLLRLADTYQKLGLSADAEKLYISVLQARKDSAEAQNYLAKLGLASLYADTRPDDATAILAELQSVKIPEFAYSIRTVIDLGSLLSKTSGFQAAMSLYSDSLLFMPLPYLDRFLVMQKIAELEIAHGDTQRAIRFIQSSLSLLAIPSKEKSVAVQTLCNCYINSGSFVEATTTLQKYLGFSGFSENEKSMMLQLLGSIKLKCGETTDAIDCFNTILTMKIIPSKSRSLAVQSLCNSYIKLDRMKDARDLVIKQLNSPIPYADDERGALFYLLGHIHNKNREKDKAVENFIKALNLMEKSNPLYSHCLLATGYVLHALKDFVLASQYISESLNFFQGTGIDKKSAYTTLYECYISIGSCAEAEKIRDILSTL